MTHFAKPSQHLQNLQEAFRLIIEEAAKQFPEGSSDLDKWEWTRVLTLVLTEAAIRRNHPPKKIVQYAEKIVRRQLEREKAASLLEQDFKPLETK